ncbi:MAG TPA: polysaccharide deacetylase family protein [Candidatus Acidoferrum sp.]|nr:polysaccharide deacetylase family protein [Candidatus Acidoferrum sp.]
MKHIALFLVLAGGIFSPSSFAQQPAKTLPEKLGYPRDAKLLIVHADDLGATHSVNAASIRALESGGINSASLMVPCPWFPEIADYAKSHPAADFGLHLTLTSERVFYRWGSVAPRDIVPSLIDSNGYFHHDWPPATRIDPKDVEIELRAQIARALAMGVKPTHLDSHQNRLFQTNKDLFAVALRLARENNLPLLLPRNWFADFPFLEKTLGPNDVVIDRVVTMEPGVPPSKWNDFYKNALLHLEPGVTEFVVHLAYADAEMKAATRERDTWGADWRQRDFDFFSGDEFQKLLRDNQIHLITWRDIGRTMVPPAKSE